MSEPYYSGLLQQPRISVGAIIAFDRYMSRSRRPPELSATEVEILRNTAEDFQNNNIISDRALRYAQGSLRKIEGILKRLTINPIDVERYHMQWRGVDRSLQVNQLNDTMLVASCPKVAWPTMKRTIFNKFHGVKCNDEKQTAQIRRNYFNVRALMNHKFTIDADTAKWMSELEFVHKPGHLRNVKGTLRGFQVDGAHFMVAKKGRALLADEQGLGKTVQTLVALEQMSYLWPVLIVGPSCSKISWAREAAIWTDRSVSVLSGRTVPPNWKPETDIVIANYDILQYWQYDMEGHFRWVIFDESQYLINSKTKRAEAVRTIVGSRKRSRDKKVPVACLSGTPIESKTEELYFSCSLIEPDLFGTKDEFVSRFAPTAKGVYGKESTSKDMKLLNQVLKSTIMLRRLKDDVLPDLPPKQRVVVPLELTNRLEYARAESDFMAWLSQNDPEKLSGAARVKGFAKVQALKRIAYAGKKKGIKEWIERYLENEDKLVVFGWHKEAINDVVGWFAPHSVKIDGDVTGDKRQKAVDSFQGDPFVKLLMGQLKAAGTNLTLTAAHATATIELWWNPSTHGQAEDRVHRIGQTHDSVFAYYLMGVDTIEERIAEMIDAKKVVSKAVLDGEDPENSELFTELLKFYRRKLDVV